MLWFILILVYVFKDTRVGSIKINTKVESYTYNPL